MSKTEETVIPFETVRVPNGDKPKGFEQVITDGIDGLRTVTYSDDGQILSDRTRHPKNEVVYFGTKEDGERQDSISSGDAGDATVSQENKIISTTEQPQEETEKFHSQNTETHEDSFVPPITGYLNQSQGRFSQNKEIFNVNVTALKKAALEAGRLLVLAIPGILIAVLTDNPELGGALGGTILLVLKSLDRGIHEDKSTQANGILPF